MAVSMAGMSFNELSLNIPNNGTWNGDFNLKVNLQNEPVRTYPSTVLIEGPTKERELAVAFFDAYKTLFGDAIVKSRKECLERWNEREGEIDLPRVTSENLPEAKRVKEIASEVFEFIAEAKDEDFECNCENLWTVIAGVAAAVLMIAAAFLMGATLGVGVFAISVIVLSTMGPLGYLVFLVLCFLWGVGLGIMGKAFEAYLNNIENERRGVPAPVS